MKNLLRIGVIAGIIILGAILISRFENEDGLELISQNEIENKAIPETRSWLSLSLNKVNLNADISEYLLNPMIIKSFGDTLYISDFSDMKIKRFSPKGVFIDQYGDSIGRGPEDLQQVLGFTLNKNKLYVIDGNTFLIKVFDKNIKKLKTSINIDFHASKIISLKDKQIAIGAQEELFTVYDSRDSVYNNFGTFSDKQLLNILSYGGYLVPVKEPSSFIYIPKFASYLFYQNIDGEQLKTVKTIDRLEFPKSRVTETGIRVPKSPIAVESVTANEKYLFLQYTRASQNEATQEGFKEIHSFIDIYTLNGEEYKGSILLPSWTNGLSIIDNTIYTIRDSDRTIQAFELPKFN